MSSFRLTMLSIGCAALLGAMPAVARAQESGAPHDPAASCLASIPDSALRRVIVYVEAELVDSTDKSILPGVDLLTQMVADGVRASLGAEANQLPIGEPEVTWRTLDDSLLVVVRRDGRITSEIPTWKLRSSTDDYGADTAAAHLLASALGAAAEDGGYVMVWPEGFEPDSVALYLTVHYPLVDSHGVVRPFRARQTFPLFSVAVPTEDPVVVRRRSFPRYPKGLSERGVSGDLIMRFVVDTTGHAEMATVRDVWPSSQPRLTGWKGAYYENFRREVLQSLPNTEFEPARVGGCKVRQLVEMPFGFKSSR